MVWLAAGCGDVAAVDDAPASRGGEGSALGGGGQPLGSADGQGFDAGTHSASRAAASSRRARTGAIPTAVTVVTGSCGSERPLAGEQVFADQRVRGMPGAGHRD